jgi:hypothetical protein
VVVLTLGLPYGHLREFAQRIDGLSVIVKAIGGKLSFFRRVFAASLVLRCIDRHTPGCGCNLAQIR